MALVLCLCFSSSLLALPTGPEVINGSANFSTEGNTLTVQNSDGAIISWQSFNIAVGESVSFVQPSSGSVVSRVVGDSPALILGTLTSNGKIELDSPGDIFLNGSINVPAGIAISTNGLLALGGNIVSGGADTTGGLTLSSSGATLVVSGFITNGSASLTIGSGGSISIAGGQVVNNSNLTVTNYIPPPSPIIPLSPGWNLVGNGADAPFSVAFLNDSTRVITVWKWVTSGSTSGVTYPAWAFFTPTQNDGGQTYAASKGYDFLTAINVGEGFWVNAKTEFTISLPPPSGLAVHPTSFMPAVASQVTSGGTHALPHGWSLIATGYGPTPAEFDWAIATALSTPPASGQAYANLTSLWAWDAARAGWYFWAPSLVNSGGLAAYSTNKGYLDFATMPNNPTGMLLGTMGFWVNMP